jgi:hypothetical protein
MLSLFFVFVLCIKKKDSGFTSLLYNLTNDLNVVDSRRKNEKILSSCFKIIKAILSLKKDGNIKNPIVLVQSDDAGDRCAFFCSILILIFQYLKTNKIDVFQTVRKLRQTRTNMLSTFVSKVCCVFSHDFDEKFCFSFKQSYQFLYEVMVEFIETNGLEELDVDQDDSSVLI